LPNSGKSRDFCQIVESLKTFSYLDFVLYSMDQPLLFCNGRFFVIFFHRRINLIPNWFVEVGVVTFCLPGKKVSEQQKIFFGNHFNRGRKTSSTESNYKLQYIQQYWVCKQLMPMAEKGRTSFTNSVNKAIPGKLDL
jgi:hypothetical protein